MSSSSSQQQQPQSEQSQQSQSQPPQSFLLSTRALDDAFTELLNGNFDSDTKICAVTMMRILDNVLQKPYDRKVRTVRTANAAFRSKVGCRPGGIEFLLACGFERQREPPPPLDPHPEAFQGEERLVLTEERENQRHLIAARRILLTRATRDLGMEASELPEFKLPPPHPPSSSAAAFGSNTVAATATTTTTAAAFNPYVGHRHDAASASIGVKLGPDDDDGDNNYVSKTEAQLLALQKKRTQLERTMQVRDVADREWRAYRPGESVAVSASAASSSSKTGSSSSSAGHHTTSDAGLLQARFKQQEEARKKREQFSTKAMRDLDRMKKQSVYSHTLLTIQFSDGCKLLGVFSPKETVGTVIDAVRNDCFLAETNRRNSIDLYVTPPRRVLDPKSTLQSEQLVPAAKLYVGWNKKPGGDSPSDGGGVGAGASPGSYLQPELFSSSPKAPDQSLFPSSRPLHETDSSTTKEGGGDDGNKNKKKDPAVSREDMLLRRMMGGAGGGGGGLGGGGGGGGTKKDPSKKPKWFKG